MENKKTSELLDLVNGNFEDKEGIFDWEKYEEIVAELSKRFPFSEILGKKEEADEYSLEERIESNEQDVKLLKRHKHEEKSGDVMIRI